MGKIFIPTVQGCLLIDALKLNYITLDFESFKSAPWSLVKVKQKSK